MQDLSSAVLYFTPPQQDTNSKPFSSPSCDPELIIFLSWMAARDLHIAKYISQHRAMFPSSAILLIRAPIDHVLYPPRARAQLAAAIPILKELATSEDKSEEVKDAPEPHPRVLVHMFSNGGVNSAVRVCGMLKAELQRDICSNDKTVTLPRYVLLMDSCPGYFQWQRTCSALSKPLPWWASPMIYIVVTTAWLFYKLRLTLPSQDINARALRTPSLVQVEARRAYLYGKADDMIDWLDVEDHARRAALDGFNVKTVRFDDGKHVSMGRSEPDRYWRTVRETWDGNAAGNDTEEDGHTHGQEETAENSLKETA